MSEQETSTVRKVVWSEIFPWLILVRCFRIAIQLRLLLCGALGVLLMLTGWWVLGYLFSGNEAVRADAERAMVNPWLAPAELIGDRPGLLAALIGVPPGDAPLALPAPGRGRIFPASEGRRFGATYSYWGIWEHLGDPWGKLFNPKVSPRTFTDRLTRFVFLLLCGLWAVAVWALLAGAITRAAAVELATHDRAKTVLTLRYAAAKWRAYFAAPAAPLAGMIALAVPIVVLGVLLRTGITGWITALVWPLLLIDGFLMALLALGLLFGWPLMFANVSVEGIDSFDAIGRAYNYVFQRPLQYLFYALVATGVGALGWLLVWNFVAAIVALTYGAAAWGAGSARMEALVGGGGGLGALGIFASALIVFFVQVLKLLGTGFLYSYFWTASTAIYFLLRRSADATEMDEVCPEEEEQPAAAAPPAPVTTPAPPPAQETLPVSQAE